MCLLDILNIPLFVRFIIIIFFMREKKKEKWQKHTHQKKGPLPPYTLPYTLPPHTHPPGKGSNTYVHVHTYLNT